MNATNKELFNTLYDKLNQETKIESNFKNNEFTYNLTNFCLQVNE
jgi:hypothetical protein